MRPVLDNQPLLQEGSASYHKVIRLGPDLGHLFEKVIRSWGADHVRHLETHFGPGADLPMERMALLTGTLRGILVARSSREFPAWLQNQRDGLAPPHFSEAEAFEEMLSLFALTLSHNFWNPNTFTVGPIHPFPSIPLDWPEGKPTSSCGLLVEGFKVELRLWKMD